MLESGFRSVCATLYFARPYDASMLNRALSMRSCLNSCQ